MIYRDLPLEERIARVAEQGLPAIEFWGWTNKDLPAIARAATAHHLAISSFSYAYPGGIIDAAHFDAFVADYMQHGNGAISISAPQGRDASAAIAYFGERLANAGIPRERILVGTHDPLVPARLVDEMHARIADSTLITFGGGHLFFLRQAQAFLDAVLAFLDAQGQ